MTGMSSTTFDAYSSDMRAYEEPKLITFQCKLICMATAQCILSNTCLYLLSKLYYHHVLQ
jgi:hypothetical protein